MDLIFYTPKKQHQALSWNLFEPGAVFCLALPGCPSWTEQRCSGLIITLFLLWMLSFRVCMNWLSAKRGKLEPRREGGPEKMLCAGFFEREGALACQGVVDLGQQPEPSDPLAGRNWTIWSDGALPGVLRGVHRAQAGPSWLDWAGTHRRELQKQTAGASLEFLRLCS